MRDVGRLLRDADPLAQEAGLAPSTADDMRRAIVSAARDSSQAAVWWPRPIVVAATVAMMLTAGVILGRSLPWREARTTAALPQTSSATHAANAERRQLQFSTPGGTRIIWVFDPEFNP